LFGWGAGASLVQLFTFATHQCVFKGGGSASVCFCHLFFMGKIIIGAFPDSSFMGGCYRIFVFRVCRENETVQQFS
jgi:hypothetical protein